MLKCVYVYLCIHDGAYVCCEYMLEHVHVVCTCWSICVVYDVCMMEDVCGGLCVCAAYSRYRYYRESEKTPRVVA